MIECFFVWLFLNIAGVVVCIVAARSLRRE